jgi:glycosyltransferase involved in cell wall biosynthesis
MGTPLVSITVPCYRQLDHARRCVSSILAQSFGDFEVTLLDDAGSEEYRRLVESLGDPRVGYRRNPARLGAMPNMFQAIGEGRAKYSLAFHEDDLLGRDYLAAAVAILESHPECGFVAAELHEFRDESLDADLSRPAIYPAYELYPSAVEFLRAIFRGVNPMFGSVVYRRAAVNEVGHAPHEEFGTLVDRPFLLAILHNWSAAVIREPLVWYRRHNDDARHETMTAEHILRLFRTYRATMPAPMSKLDQALFYTYSGYWLFALYDLVADEHRPPLRQFLFRVWREGLYQPKWHGRFGLRLVQRAIVSNGRRPPP